MPFDWSGATGGATAGGLSGAASGAYIGSVVPGVGTAIGAGVGGILGALGGGVSGGYSPAIGGSAPGFVHKSRYTPQQLQALQQLLMMGQQGLQNPYAGFEPIQRNATNYFQQQLVPYLQNQFQSQGGGRNASHFSSGLLQGNLYGAGASLADKLALAQMEYGQQNRRNAFDYIREGLQPYSDIYQTQGQPGLARELLPYAGRAALGAASGYLGNKNPENRSSDILNAIIKQLGAQNG